jgi:hypothetical protein
MTTPCLETHYKHIQPLISLVVVMYVGAVERSSGQLAGEEEAAIGTTMTTSLDSCLCIRTYIGCEPKPGFGTRQAVLAD